MSLFEKVEEYVTSLLKKEPTSAYPYHNLHHTQSVVRHAAEIGMHEGIEQKELDIVIISAWFHDIGYITDYVGHEEKGAVIARNFLSNVNSGLASRVESCILATHMPQQPHSHLEKILCDADMYHLSEPDLLKGSDLLRKEINMVLNRNVSLPDYLIRTLELLQTHQYFTEYARNNLKKGKEKNIQKITSFLSSKQKL